MKLVATWLVYLKCGDKGTRLAKENRRVGGENLRVRDERLPRSIDIYRPTHLDGIELRVGRGITEAYPSHWHEELQLCAVTAGSGYLQSRGTAYFTPRESLFCAAPGEVHSNRVPGPGGVNFRSIYIAARWFESVGGDPGTGRGRVPEFRSGLLMDVRTLRGYLRLHVALTDCYSRLRSESLLVEFLGNLVERHSADGTTRVSGQRDDRRTVGRVREYLTDNYARAVSLAELAQLSCLSPFHLHRMFSRVTGMPPHAYQLQVRIVRARSLLLQKWPIADVASETGFADQSHFTRHFKRLMAVTPGEYVGQRSS